jgi:hypothetical protein
MYPYFALKVRFAYVVCFRIRRSISMKLYLIFTLKVAGFKVPAFVAKIVTTSQILQMIIIMGIQSLTIFYNRNRAVLRGYS